LKLKNKLIVLQAFVIIILIALGIIMFEAINNNINSIEAAGAGEAGKGFAVVANEATNNVLGIEKDIENIVKVASNVNQVSKDVSKIEKELQKLISQFKI
jgi:hypothetical protein